MSKYIYQISRQRILCTAILKCADRRLCNKYTCRFSCVQNNLKSNHANKSVEFYKHALKSLILNQQKSKC